MRFWFLATIACIGIELWWLTQHLPNGPRETAVFGVLLVAAAAFRTGMTR